MNLRKRQIKKTREMKKMVEGKDVKIDEEKGTYLYCIVEGNANEDFGNIGIENSRVYTIFFKDVSAVVHSCKAEPYNSKDDVIVKGWILAHQNVVDKAMEKYGTVIPLGFDTIVKGDEKALKEWIEEDYGNMKNKFEKIRGKKEYSVQIFIYEKIISNKKISSKSSTLLNIEKQNVHFSPSPLFHLVLTPPPNFLSHSFLLCSAWFGR